LGIALLFTTPEVEAKIHTQQEVHEKGEEKGRWMID
jgi:hypothetical protein